MVGALSAGNRATAQLPALHGDSPQALLGRLAEDGARDLVGGETLRFAGDRLPRWNGFEASLPPLQAF
jgi:hypothetical protein